MNRPVETENIHRLLRSGQIESVMLGLQLAESLQIDLDAFVADVEQLYRMHWLIDHPDVSLAEKIAEMYSRQHLDLSRKKLTQLPELVGQLTKLEHLRINENQLTELPDFIRNLTALKHLNVSDNQLTALPDWIGELTNLTYLNLSNNQITELPDSIGKLKNLESFSVTHNRLGSLPDTIGKLEKLSYFDLATNQFSVFPESIIQLPQLRNLSLYENQLLALPDSIGQLSQLESLGLSSNQLITLPTSIGKLHKLVWLYLESNQLSTLPDSIGNLSSLIGLYLSNNRLTEIPETLGNLTELLYLSLARNQLNEIPSVLSQLPQLEELDLANDSTVQLSEALQHLKDSRKTQSDNEVPVASMQNYYEEHADAIAYFKVEARQAFVGICQEYNFQEQQCPPNDYQNQFQIVFASPSIRILAEGIHWGMNTRISLSRNVSGCQWYGVERLMAERKPATPIVGSQIEQLYGYAHYLQTQAADLLAGDVHLLEQWEVAQAQEQEDSKRTNQAETDQKLAAGYVPIENPYGESILRKPRVQLPDFEVARTQFPEATAVTPSIFAEVLLQGTENDHVAIIDQWFKDIGELVHSNEILCELSTDKVVVEMPSPTSGKLVWLLPEGTLVQANDVIALIISD